MKVHLEDPAAWISLGGIVTTSKDDAARWVRAGGRAFPLYRAPQSAAADIENALHLALEALCESDTVFYPKTKWAIAAITASLSKHYPAKEMSDA